MQSAQIHQIREYHVKPEDGLTVTLQIMNELEGRAITSDFFRTEVKKIFEQFRYPKITLYEKIWEYVRTEFEYVKDRFDEEIKNPLLMFHYKAGDCDDFSLFIKSVLSVFGIRSSYILLGQRENEFTHIAVLTNDGFILDGSNELLNWIHPKYKFKKIA